MSLVHAANHLAAQGRGEDTHLVHMTSKELAAMQKLAESQGKSLTINPKTGLPEAGMLSTVLPMALGALAVATGQVEFLPLIAAGVGAADYAITGSLTQGLMAGLGTWSGGNLASGIAEAGAAATANAAAQEGGNQAAQEFAKQQAVTEATRMTAQETAQQTASDIAKSQISSMPNLTEGQITNMTANLTDANAAEAVKNAGMANANMGLPTVANAANMSTGELARAGLSQGLTSGPAIGNAVMANPYAAAGVALPLGLAAKKEFGPQPPNNPVQTQQKNPFGMKQIPRDANGSPMFNASMPAQPNPAYRPTYSNYAASPYSPIGSASGGLMNDKMMASGGIASYKGSPDYGSMVEGVGEVERGIEMATKRKALEAQNRPVEIEPDEPELRRLDPASRARKMLEMLSNSSRVRLSKGLPQQNVLGSISTDPAQMIAEQRAKQAIAQESSTEAKEGGLMAMANGGVARYDFGGVAMGAAKKDSAPSTFAYTNPQGSMRGHIYQPQYVDYAQAPSQGIQSPSIQNYESIPIPTRTATPVQGYAIDPLRMYGSPAYKANELAIAEQVAQSEETRRAADAANAAADSFYHSTVANAAGGLMGYAGGGHLGDYSDGGRLLQGPGDGVSDSIPATIGGKQPARLATGEFVIPARIVSEIGNGSTDAGAKRLYAMMDRIKAKRAKTKNIAADTKAYKHLPA
jgi:hypothetical protein